MYRYCIAIEELMPGMPVLLEVPDQTGNYVRWKDALIMLRALSSIAHNTCCDACQEASKVARNALESLPAGPEDPCPPPESLPPQELEMDCSAWDSRCVQLEQQLIKVQANYSELLHAVGKAYPGMSRHQIALQYIRNAEMPAQPPDPPKQERA